MTAEKPDDRPTAESLLELGLFKEKHTVRLDWPFLLYLEFPFLFVCFCFLTFDVKVKQLMEVLLICCGVSEIR